MLIAEVDGEGGQIAEGDVPLVVQLDLDRPDGSPTVGRLGKMRTGLQPLVNPLHFRVNNLTIWADSRPFWRISVHSSFGRSTPAPLTPVDRDRPNGGDRRDDAHPRVDTPRPRP